jgi:hypothetical protein
MHPTVAYEIAKARLADQRRQAEQAAMTRAARLARRALAPPPAYPAAGLARRALSLLAAAGRAVHGRSRPSAACQPLAPCAGCA